MFKTKKEVKDIINKALDILYDKDKFLLQQSYDINERTITSKLASYLQNIIGDNADVDVEYNRMFKIINGQKIETDGDYFYKTVCLANGKIDDSDTNGSRVFPDIIVHKRNTDKNYIIIEVKKGWKKCETYIEYDFKKLNAYKEDLKYHHCIFLEINENRNNINLEFL